MDEIIIGGKRYKLVPEDEDVLEGYEVEKKPESKGPQRAVPKKYDYRERYKKRELRREDLIPGPSERVKLKGHPSDASAGLVGPGVEDDF
jgi:hypothetical protein